MVAIVIAATGIPASADPLSMILIIAALVNPTSGFIRGHLRGRRIIITQTLAFIVFVTIALIALYVDRDTSLVLLALGFLSHAIWDIKHHCTGTIVRRGYAEFCAVLDAINAVLLIIPLFQ